MKKRILTAISVLLVLCMALLTVSCSGDKTDGDASSKASSTASKAGETKSQAETVAAKYYDTDVWQDVPMISQALIDAGYGGGEACQQVLGLCLDSIDGKVGFFGTDVAGLYRTLDGGKTWTLQTRGFQAVGATSFAIDPCNVNRVLCVGANSAAQDVNGIHLSVDCGETWDYVFKATTYGYRDQDIQFAYDKTSFDKNLGYCTTVYWCRENNSTAKGAKNDPNIYKSTDGGKTWAKLENTSQYGGGDIFVNSKNGHVYVGNEKGVFVSKDGGKSFTKVLDKVINSMENVITKPDCIYCTTDECMYISTDGGANFTALKGTGYPAQYATHLRVSPANTDNMVMQADWGSSKKGKNKTYFTNDGGKTWKESTRHIEGQWTPSNAAESRFAWSPTDPNKVIVNWNYICMSTNAGKDFYWSNTGFSAICTSGKIRFNVNNPKLIAISSQDYNGGFSTDGGKTWNYCNYAGEAWGGYTYGAYCLDANTSWVGRASSWVAPRYVTVTHDGGKTFDRTELKIEGDTIGMGALNSDSIGFLGEWKTADKGYTWENMNDGKHGAGCVGVYTVDKTTGRLWGKDDKYYVVYSDDNGATWTQYQLCADGITDMAYNPDNKRLYVSCGSLQYSDTTAADKKGRRFITVATGVKGVNGIAIDPNDTNVMYICNSGLEKSCFRSLDGGKTWLCLTRYKGDGRDGIFYGARHVGAVGVNPETRELFVFTGCYGVYKMPCPNYK